MEGFLKKFLEQIKKKVDWSFDEKLKKKKQNVQRFPQVITGRNHTSLIRGIFEEVLV